MASVRLLLSHRLPLTRLALLENQFRIPPEQPPTLKEAVLQQPSPTLLGLRQLQVLTSTIIVVRLVTTEASALPLLRSEKSLETIR